MTRISLAVVSVVALALASSGAHAAPLQRAAQIAPAQIAIARPVLSSKVIRYRLGAVRYSPGFHPRCGPSLNAYAILGTTRTSNLSFAGGFPETIYVGPCHAKPGDWMLATLTDVYGHIAFISHPSPGNFTIKDTGNDSHAVLKITDLTTGFSVTKDVFYTY
jgi:hypothetical protein